MISNKEQKKNLSVFVSGLPYVATEQDVRNFFADCGTIEEIKLPKYQDTGRLIGYGHITFSTPEAREEAFKLSGQKLGERYIEVQPAKGESNRQPLPKKAEGAAPTNTIFIKNLPYEITEDEVGDFFRPCGSVDNVRLVYNSFKKHFKGFGFVEFKEADSAKKALELNGKDIKGRPIIVDLEYSQAKKGYHPKVSEEGNTKYNYEDSIKRTLKKKIHKKEKEEVRNPKFDKRKKEMMGQKRAEAKPDKKSQLF